MAQQLSPAEKNTRRDTINGGLLLLTLLLLCFAPFVFGNKTLLESARQAQSIMPYGSWAGEIPNIKFAKTKDPGAPAWQTEPLLELIRKEYFQERVLPVWNPYQAFGTPLAASMHPQAYYPPSILQSLFHTPRVRNWFILLHIFVAGFCTFLFTRLFISFIPALASGVTSMFAGYYILYLTMPHISVEIFLPVALLAGEHLIRTPRFRNIGWFALVIYLSLTAGMPESCFLSVAVTYLFLFFRVATDGYLRPSWRRSLGALLIATLSGFAFSAILLVPFRQYVRYAFDIHQSSNIGAVAGKMADLSVSSIFTYFFPFLFGPVGENGLRNYVGLISLFLFIIAVLSISWRRDAGNRTLSLLTCFFGFLVIALVCKRYGFWFINWIGALPLANLVLFPKYEEAEISISMSVLCGIGLERLAKWRVTPIKQVCALGLTFLVVPAAVIVCRDSIGKQLVGDKMSAQMGIWTIFFPAAVLMALSLLLILVNNYRPSALSLGVLAVLTTETLFSYFVPSYYVLNSLPTVTSNAYAGAPFVTRLQAIAGNYRIFGENSVLVPEWPSAFSLSDIRSLDAMYYRKYLPFLRQFFPLVPHPPGEDLSDRFMGVGSFPFNDYLQQRLLQLSSVKYVVTMPPTSLGPDIIDDILLQNTGRLTPGRVSQVYRTVITVGKETRVALFEHPPYDRLPYRVNVGQGKERFYFSFGINPDAFPLCGDGVEFIVEVRDSASNITRLFSKFIDPRHDLSQRKWIEGSADLSPFPGQSVDLLLTTNPGPKGDNCADWAAWSNFNFDTQKSLQPFKSVYRKEVNIYEFQNALPRAAIYYNASLQENENQVLKSLAAPDLDVSQTVLLNSQALDPRQAAWIKEMNGSPKVPGQAAEITSYRSQTVVVKASTARRGILVLNDSDFPGWTAQVDGKSAKMLTANYIFRGVLLESGNHVVRFDYNPWSVRLGASISAASLSSFALVGFLRLRKRRRRL